MANSRPHFPLDHRRFIFDEYWYLGTTAEFRQQYRFESMYAIGSQSPVSISIVGDDSRVVTTHHVRTPDSRVIETELPGLDRELTQWEFSLWVRSGLGPMSDKRIDRLLEIADEYNIDLNDIDAILVTERLRD